MTLRRSLCLALLASASIAHAKGTALSIAIPGGLQVSLDESGLYRLKEAHWTFEGKLPSAAATPLTGTGKDQLGAYQELSFQFQDPVGPMAGRIRLYEGRHVVLFRQSALKALATAPQPFPDFTTLPQGLYPFSYQQHEMAPPSFALESGANVWMLFDAKGRSLILSPASHFMTSGMIGDGKARLASGFNPALTQLPEGFAQDSVLALGSGINATWQLWGQAMTDLQGKVRPANDADTVLRSFGYWTDAGASYWYNYEKELGYEGTLKKIASSYKEQGIPLGYMQLDSWWYHKTLISPTGQQGGTRNDKLPEGDWNRYGGTIEYRAHPFVFPEGMAAFTRAIGLPVINHNRWLDPSSPYHQRYAISGLAAVDPGFWDEVADYLKDNGSIGYEQDWLNEIYKNSPELGSRVGMDDAFMGSMAEAFRKRGMSMQYCMGLPMHFLQGSKYSNLTSIRPSWDRFSPSHYRHFLYTSRLATALGIWPWCDVFMSGEADNMLLSVLSAGPVGTGDLLGKEDKATILKAARLDGVLVKPDVSLLPTDRSYLAEAKKEERPLVAMTYTDHSGIRTTYVVAYKSLSNKAEALTVEADELGLKASVYAYDSFSSQGVLLKAGKPLKLSFGDRGLAFVVAAPLSQGGIAVLGDAGKFVGTGKQRLASMTDAKDGLKLTLLLATQETALTLRGYATHAPTAMVAGKAQPLNYDAASGLFTVELSADLAGPASPSDENHNRRLELTLN